ncbi:hypothetical protein RB595_008857 [Gaeumannomyces hyphopodioides]
MAPTLHGLPNELLVAVYKKLPLADQIQLSSAHRHLRDVGVKEVKIFRSLSLTWSKRAVSDSALPVATKYGSQVCELTVYVDEVDSQHHDTPPSIPPPTIPSSCVALLRGRDRKGAPLLLPSLERLALEFPESHLTTYGMYHDTSKGKPQLQRNNALVNAILKALAMRGRADLPVELRPITSLKLGNFPLHPSPVFASDDWRRFAGQVEDLEISIYGDDNNEISTIFQDLHFKFMQYLNETIMKVWLSVRKVRFRAHSTAPASAWSWDFPTQDMLLWEPSFMPRLENIEIENVFVTRQLLNFLIALRRARPVSLTLLEARGYWNRKHNTPHQISWADFFDSLAEIDLGFSDFTLKTVGLTMDKDHSPSICRFQVLERSAAARSKLASSPGLPIFPYFQIGELDGFICESGETTVEEFLRGEDQVAYERFVDKMASVWKARVRLL